MLNSRSALVYLIINDKCKNLIYQAVVNQNKSLSLRSDGVVHRQYRVVASIWQRRSITVTDSMPLHIKFYNRQWRCYRSFIKCHLSKRVILERALIADIAGVEDRVPT